MLIDILIVYYDGGLRRLYKHLAVITLNEASEGFRSLDHRLMKALSLLLFGSINGLTRLIRIVLISQSR